jgi:integrase
MQVRWEDIHLDGEPEIVMRPEITKTGDRRTIKLQPNAVEWFLRCQNRTGRISGLDSKKTMQNRMRRIRKMAGITYWPKDAMRHSYCSYHLNHFKDQGRLQLDLGHTNPVTLHRHYHRSVSSENAARFWSLVP